MTDNLGELANKHGRFGYRMVTGLLNSADGHVNYKRPEPGLPNSIAVRDVTEGHTQKPDTCPAAYAPKIEDNACQAGGTTHALALWTNFQWFGIHRGLRIDVGLCGREGRADSANAFSLRNREMICYTFAHRLLYHHLSQRMSCAMSGV